MCLLGNLFSRQGSSLPDGALILAVRELRSVSVIFSDTSADVPTFSWDVLRDSSPGDGEATHKKMSILPQKSCGGSSLKYKMSEKRLFSVYL